MDAAIQSADLKVSLLAITPDAQKLIEEAGRTCYLSFEKIARFGGRLHHTADQMGHDSPRNTVARRSASKTARGR